MSRVQLRRKSRSKQRKFSKRRRIRLSQETKDALDTLQKHTNLSYGRIVEIIFDGLISGNLARIGLKSREKGMKLRNIPIVFPFFRIVTIRTDLAVWLTDDAGKKLYTSGSLYAGALLQIMLNRLGITKIVAYVKSRPDVREAMTYGQ